MMVLHSSFALADTVLSASGLLYSIRTFRSHCVRLMVTCNLRQALLHMLRPTSYIADTLYIRSGDCAFLRNDS